MDTFLENTEREWALSQITRDGDLNSLTRFLPNPLWKVGVGEFYPQDIVCGISEL